MLNGDIWLRTKIWNQSNNGGTQPRADQPFLNGGTCSIAKKMNQYRTGGLILGLRAILQENGGAWSITNYLTLGLIMYPMAEALGQLPRHHYKS